MLTDYIHFNSAISLFVWLMLAHFIADWVFQRESQAKRKHAENKVRAGHALEYATVVTIFAAAYPITAPPYCPVSIQLAFSLFILFSTHYMIDSYVFTAWIMKHISKNECAQTLETLEKEFTPPITNPINMIKAIGIDQILHAIVLVTLAFWLTA